MNSECAYLSLCIDIEQDCSYQEMLNTDNQCPCWREGFSMADVKLVLLLGTLWRFGVRDVKKHKK